MARDSQTHKQSAWQQDYACGNQEPMQNFQSQKHYPYEINALPKIRTGAGSTWVKGLSKPSI